MLRADYLDLCGAALREAASWQAAEAAVTALRCAHNHPLLLSTSPSSLKRGRIDSQ